MTTKKERELFLKEYEEGKTIKDIAEQSNFKWAEVYRILKFRTQIREEKDICDLYKSGKSSVYIAKRYGVNNHLIGRILEEHNIKRVRNGIRKYQLNEHYFDEIDTPEKAYILGFFYADGSNVKSKSTINMSLMEEDKYILEAIRKEIGSERPLEFIDNSKKNDGGYKYKDQYRLLLFSAHMCKALESHGMVPNKSLVLTFPERLKPSLLSHFIRGYFDGDGCVHFAKNGNCIITITSTESFCKSLKQHLEALLDVHCCITDSACHNGITKVLSISGKYQVETFLDFIYTDATLFLQRKYSRYQEKYCNNSSRIA